MGISKNRHFHLPYNNNCGIPEHAWLVVNLVDFLDRLDPIGIVNGRIAPFEYLPEIPDLLFLLTTNTITHDNVNAVFDKFFDEHAINNYDTTDRIVEFMSHKREHWLSMTTKENS